MALITSHEAGTFVVSITPTPATEVDTNSQRIVTQGTIALGREWSASWLASWGGVTLLVVVPIVAGVAVLVLAWRRRGPAPTATATTTGTTGRDARRVHRRARRWRSAARSAATPGPSGPRWPPQ